MKKRGTLIFLLVLLLTSGAYAISVTPSKTITYFSGDSISENLYLSLKNTNRFGVLGEMSINSHNFPEEYLDRNDYICPTCEFDLACNICGSIEDVLENTDGMFELIENSIA